MYQYGDPVMAGEKYALSSRSYTDVPYDYQAAYQNLVRNGLQNYLQAKLIYYGARARTFELVSIRYTGKGRRITLARYLCGLIGYRPEEVERVHILLMYDNFLHIQLLAEKDENFKRKFGEDLESLAKILKSFRLQKSTTGLCVKKLGAQIRENLEHFSLPERNLKQVSQKIGEMYTIKPSLPTGVPLKQLPQKKYIGKGYTDQGTARNAAEDNSPSWQEVASHRPAGENSDDS